MPPSIDSRRGRSRSARAGTRWRSRSPTLAGASTTPRCSTRPWPSGAAATASTMPSRRCVAWSTLDGRPARRLRPGQALRVAVVVHGTEPALTDRCQRPRPAVRLPGRRIDRRRPGRHRSESRRRSMARCSIPRLPHRRNRSPNSMAIAPTTSDADVERADGRRRADGGALVLSRGSKTWNVSRSRIRTWISFTGTGALACPDDRCQEDPGVAQGGEEGIVEAGDRGTLPARPAPDGSSGSARHRPVGPSMSAPRPGGSSRH